MIIVMHHEATAAQIEAVADKIREQGLDVNISRGTERTVVGVSVTSASSIRCCWKPCRVSSRH